LSAPKSAPPADEKNYHFSRSGARREPALSLISALPIAEDLLADVNCPDGNVT
jgi:hypothetical protein